MTLESYRTAERVRRGVGQLYRDVEQLKRRLGTRVGDFADANHEHAVQGTGPFLFDYLIDPLWLGRGAEGKVFVTFHGHTFKVYSTIAGAIEDADTVRQTANQATTFAILGTHTLSAALTPTPPTLGVYHFYGMGIGRTVIRPSANGVTVLTVPSGITDPYLFFYGISFEDNSKSSITLIGEGDGCAVRLFICEINLNNSANKGLELGSDSRGHKFYNCEFTGSAGIGISAASDVYLFIYDSDFEAMTVGIDLNNAADVVIEGNSFDTCGIGVRFAGNASISGVSILGNRFNNPNTKAIEFLAGTNIQSGLKINDNIFSLVASGDVAIDFDPMTGSGLVHGAEIKDNIFTGSGSAIGIRGDTGAVTNSIASGNIFRGFTSGNEITAWTGAGNEAYHSISTSDVGVKQAMADIGNPIGHSTPSAAAAMALIP